MSQHPPERVRVSGPVRRRSSRPPTREEIDAGTRLGGVYITSLLREQLRLAGRVLAALALGVGSLPLVFHLWPGLADVDLFGVPLPWLLLGILVHPFLLLLGRYYVRRAEANERDFADLVDEG